MKKRIVIITAVIILILMFTGCSANELEYDANLGYDLNKAESENITFNVYHSDTKDHSWELIASFPCKAESGHYSDVRIENKGNKITAQLTDSTYTKSDDGNSTAYNSAVVTEYDFIVEGLKESLQGYGQYAVKNKSGEQPVRLYPVSNSDGVYLSGEEVSLDKPYDIEGENLDNILITIVMN